MYYTFKRSCSHGPVLKPKSKFCLRLKSITNKREVFFYRIQDDDDDEPKFSSSFDSTEDITAAAQTRLFEKHKTLNSEQKIQIIFDAAHGGNNRLSRRQLPRITEDGFVEYGLQIQQGDSGGGGGRGNR